jgi:hypothetical protein
MIEKCLILYKGDKLAGSFYLLVGVILMFFSIGLYLFTISVGYFYLSVGLAIFSFYCIGKGSFIMYTSHVKMQYFKKQSDLDISATDTEIAFTEFRIYKKNRNRTRYTRVVILSSVIAFAGLFTSEKGLISGTAIPIAFISGLEIGIGLLTEFRLREYLRILNKHRATF